MAADALVLLVEDEALVRTVLEEILGEAGFQALAVANGHQALAELEGDATRFRAVLTDIRLGRSPDGWEVARRARELVPDMPVLYLSGNSAYKWAARGVPNSLMVDKPYSAAQMVSALTTLLNQADSR
ncbi:MAG TPA: response regulator [Rubellimicrobium sp.]|jgi:CheY-like chemotaxis protein|nr:response regulator [Rubellimicrobium sp.]